MRFVGTSSMMFFNKRSQIVGAVLAVVVILMHVIVGLGFLWPVVAIGAWGAGAALTPPTGPGPDNPQQPSAPKPLPMNPDVLREKVGQTIDEARRARPRAQLSTSVDSLSASLWGVLAEWDQLDAVPEQQVTVTGIINHYFPNVILAYAGVPDYARDRAVEPTMESLEMLTAELESIRLAIGENNVRTLENHRDLLQFQFGKTPDLPLGESSQASDDTDPVDR